MANGVDYDALARTYGATSSQPPDYDALAKQHGAINPQGPAAASPIGTTAPVSAQVGPIPSPTMAALGTFLRGTAGDVGHLVGQSWEEAKDIGRGMYGLATDPSVWVGPGLAKHLIIDPAIAKNRAAIAAAERGEQIPALLGGLSVLNPFAPDVTRLYQQSAAGDVSGAAGRGLVDILALRGFKRAAETPEQVARVSTNVAKAIEADANHQLVAGLAQKAADRADAYRIRIQRQFHLGEHVQKSSVAESVAAIQHADAADLASRGENGSIDMLKVKEAADEGLGRVGIQAGRATGNAQKLLAGYPPRISWQQAKELRTVLSNEFERGDPADRLVIGGARQALTEQLEARAEQLGHSAEFKSYNDIHSKLEAVREQWLGKLVNATNPEQLASVLRGGFWRQITRWGREVEKEHGAFDSKAFKEDVGSFLRNAEWGKPPEAAGRGGIFGQFRNIITHPLTAGATYFGAQAAGLPFLARFLAVAGAARTSEFLRQLREPLVEEPPALVGKRPRPGGGGGSAPPAAGPSGGGAPPVGFVPGAGTRAVELASPETAPRTTAATIRDIKARLKGGGFTEEEEQQAEKMVSDYEDRAKELRKLRGARRTRAPKAAPQTKGELAEEIADLMSSWGKKYLH